MLRELHLFAGVGGGILAGRLLGHCCVGAVEIDSYCRGVLEARQRDGILEPFPIHDDIKTFDATPWRGHVDIVCGGFPCQPWSVAGKRKGCNDPRHLWPEMARVVGECRPPFVFAENVSMAAFADPWRDLRGMGYRVPPALCLAAAEVGAPHRRKRWWLLATDADSAWLREQYNKLHLARTIGETTRTRGASKKWPLADSPSIGRGERRPEPTREQGRLGVAGSGSSVGDPNSLRQLQPQGIEFEQWRRTCDAGWWVAEPNVGRVANGVPARVDRLRGLGNAQVPVQAATAFRELMRLHYATS